MDDEEREEGEISENSDEEITSISKQATSTSTVQPYRSNGSTNNTLARNYRSFRPPGLSSSESEVSNSDDEQMPWKRKKDRHSSCDIDIPQNEGFENTPFAQAAMKNLGYQPGKKRNNIWGSVILEQTITQSLAKSSVDKIKSSDSEDDREVENYDYKKAYADDRPYVEVNLEAAETTQGTDDIFGDNVHDDLEHCEEKTRRMKRKRPLQERIGRRKYDMNKSRAHIEATVDDTLQQVAMEIARHLKEQKTELIERVVLEVGKKKSLELLYLTEDTEAAGGMWTMDGSRRRTPGGVFFQLLKLDHDVRKEQVDAVFKEDRDAWKARHKERRRINRRKKMVTKVKETEMKAEDNQADNEDYDDDLGDEPIDPLLELQEEEEEDLPGQSLMS